MCGLCHDPGCDGFSHVQDMSVGITSSGEVGSGTPLADIVAQLNRGNFGWNNASPITYTFTQTLPGYAEGESEYAGFEAFNQQQMDMARLALSTWGDVADLLFWELDASYAKIGFASSSTLASYSAAHAYLPSYGSWGGDVWVNSDLSYNVAPDVGNYGFKVLVHEIGHAIGQLHPGDYNAGSGKLTYQNNAVYAEDSRQYTIMSYWDETHTGADFGDYYAQTPMLHDVLAIQAKYGVNWTTRTDDTVYGFNSNTDSEIYDFELNAHPVLCIWDAGGVDTLDLSGFEEASVVNLNPGTFSSAAGLVNNISIAYGAEIEHVVTGDADDWITGNSLDNNVDGGEGYDVFCINTGLADTKTLVLDDGRVVIASDQGVDQLVNVEGIDYDDISIDLAAVTANSILEYAASYGDLADAYGTDKEMLYEHLLEYGLSENRSIPFSAMDYLASYDDLWETYGADAEAGARHFIEYGRFEGREVTFDPEAYLAENPEVAAVYGADTVAAEHHAAEHYIAMRAHAAGVDWI